MGSKSDPYVSCIVISGRPILPPVMTPFRCEEMRRYRELALAVETKNSARRNRSSAAARMLSTRRESNGILAASSTSRGDDDIQDCLTTMEIGADQTPDLCLQSRANVNPFSRSEAVRSPCHSPHRTCNWASLSTPPSVASTDLDRYMCYEGPESECPDSTIELDAGDDTSSMRNLVSNCSSTALITPQGLYMPQDRTKSRSSSSGDEEYSDPCNIHCRRSSYTLEQPSPVLLAHLQKLAVKSAMDPMEAKAQTPTEETLLKDCRVPGNADVATNPSAAKLIANPFLSLRKTCVDTELLDKQESMFMELKRATWENLNRLGDQWEAKMKQTCAELESDLESSVEEPKILGESESGAEQLKHVSQDKASTHREIAENDLGMVDADISADGSGRVTLNCALSKSTLNCNGNDYRTGEDDSMQQRLAVDNSTDDLRTSLKFQRLSAAVKGFLTRRLLRTEKVQAIIQTIKDTLEFALQLHSETPMKRGCVTSQDANLHQRLIAQLSGACIEFHDVFFKLTIGERMKIIAQDRELKRQKSVLEELNERPSAENRRQHRRLSSATLKSIERKRHHGRQSPRSPFSYRGRSPRSRISDQGYLRRMSEALDEARPYSASPRFGSDEPSKGFPVKASCSRSLSYARQRVIKAKHKPQLKWETKRPHSTA